MEESQSTATIPAPIPTPSKSRIVLFPWIFILLLLGAFGFLLVQNMNLMKKISDLESVQSTPPTPTQIAEWRSIAIYEWIFKTPTDWNYLDCSASHIMMDENSIIENDKKAESFECSYDSPPAIIEVQKIPHEDKEFLQYIQFSEKKILTIDGFEATYQKATRTSEYAKGQESIIVYVQQTDGITKIVLWNLNYKSIFDQILSTFTFAN